MKNAKIVVLGIAVIFLVGCGAWAPVVPAEDGSPSGAGGTNSVEWVVNDKYSSALDTARGINRAIPSPFQGLIELALSGIAGGLAVWAKLRSGQKQIVRNLINTVATHGESAVKTELAKNLAIAGLVPQFKEEVRRLVDSP